MRKYAILISPEAQADIENFFYHICFVYKQPLTAARNRDGLYKAIKQLSVYAGSIAVSQNDFVQSHFGPGARCISYKKMVIIYVMYGAYANIKRVIPGALIY
ncbi:MAG: hypothetical protein LBG47_02545 [Prevotellaceae bacterium]|jgi:plasmid stabilization system protein ParE|nr:hypothetical protein [Prevotellaceae bacterium]